MYPQIIRSLKILFLTFLTLLLSISCSNSQTLKCTRVVDGDTMEDEFFAGDRIIVSPNAHCNSGDYCVVKIVDTAALKKYIKKGK